MSSYDAAVEDYTASRPWMLEGIALDERNRFVPCWGPRGEKGTPFDVVHFLALYRDGMVRWLCEQIDDISIWDFGGYWEVVALGSFERSTLTLALRAACEAVNEPTESVAEPVAAASGGGLRGAVAVPDQYGASQDGSQVTETHEPMRIYVASSWRNTLQQAVVHTLRAAGHEVYDFKNPRPGEHGFAWSDIDRMWQGWTVEEYQRALAHPIAEAGFKSDKDALDWAECGVLVMPCGRSAHLELGYLAGQGKPCAVLACERMEPELMVKLASGGILASFDELLAWTTCPSQESRCAK